MKLFKTLSITVIFFCLVSTAVATELNGRINILNNDGSNYKVMLQVNTDLDPGELGGATIILDYDNTILSYPDEPEMGLDFIFYDFNLFLFRRIRKAGKDNRFDELKPYFSKFLNVWTIQGLWITFTVAAALAAITTTERKQLDWLALAGLLVWVTGFTTEVLADAQKSRFSANPANKGSFIQTGLWSHSRHPNYFGEIILWVGVALIAVAVLHGWQWFALVSPVFVALQLTLVSGVPMLEKKADLKWGGQEDYEAYKKRTPVFIPRL